jgi:hypothetical protein
MQWIFGVLFGDRFPGTYRRQSQVSARSTYNDCVLRYRLPRVLTVTGIIATLFGLLGPFIDRYLLFSVFLPALGVGLLLVSVGLVMWSLRAARAGRLQLAAGLLIGGILACNLAVSSAYVWGLLFLAGLVAMLLGLMILGIHFLAGEPEPAWKPRWVRDGSHANRILFPIRRLHEDRFDSTDDSGGGLPRSGGG